MKKLKVTAQQRANALEALFVMWPSVPPKNVSWHLTAFREDDDYNNPPKCGTISCFGGWAIHWPNFRRQRNVDLGIFTQIYNLFGRSNVADVRGAAGAMDRGFNGTDHELVSHRLRWLITHSEVVA